MQYNNTPAKSKDHLISTSRCNPATGFKRDLVYKLLLSLYKTIQKFSFLHLMVSYMDQNYEISSTRSFSKPTFTWNFYFKKRFSDKKQNNFQMILNRVISIKSISLFITSNTPILRTDRN